MSYTHFTLTERFYLQELLNQKKSFREIAKEMNRSPSTISREVRRNWSKKKNRYNPWRATTLYIIRRKSCVRQPAIIPDSELYKLIHDGLSQYWSPEITADYCRRKGYSISFKTIYKAVRSGIFPDIKPQTHFRRKGKKHHRA